MDNNAAKGSLKSGAELMKIQAQSVAASAGQYERDQEDRERRFVALVHSYLSEHGLVAVPKTITLNNWLIAEYTGALDGSATFIIKTAQGEG